MICDECKGQGNLLIDIKYDPYDNFEDIISYRICKKCDGSGQIDNWVENVFGKKNENFNKDSYNKIWKVERKQFTDSKIPIVKLKMEL